MEFEIKAMILSTLCGKKKKKYTGDVPGRQCLLLPWAEQGNEQGYTWKEHVFDLLNNSFLVKAKDWLHTCEKYSSKEKCSSNRFQEQIQETGKWLMQRWSG